MGAPTQALAEFRASVDRLVASVDGVLGATWLFKPSPSVWSMAEVIEHVTMTDRGVRGVASRALRPFGAGEHRAVDDATISTIFDGAGPPPPEAQEPTGTWTDPAAALGDFTSAADALAAWYADSEADLRALTFEHPVFGLLDGVQWLLFAASHHDNHTRDLCELRRLSSSAAT